MKKLLWLIVCLMTMVIGLSSCSTKTYEVTANYDVCYPDGTKNYDETTKRFRDFFVPLHHERNNN